MEIEHSERLSAACERLNSLEDASSVMKYAVDSASEFQGIDSAGIYILEINTNNGVYSSRLIIE